MAASLKEIAKEVGVSVNTVSRVINGKGKGLRCDAAERAKQILAVADRHNYRPHSAARAMRSKRFFNLGYFQTNFWHRHFGEYGIESGIYETASRLGYNVMLIQELAKSDATGRLIPKAFRELSLDAVVVSYGSSLAPELVEALDQADVPVVYLNERRRYNAVYVDDWAIAQRMTQFLLEQGYRRIAFTFLVRRADHYSQNQRVDGYCQSMIEAGLTPEVKDWGRVESVGEAQAVGPQVRAWLKGKAAPQAVICYNDLSANRLQRLLYGSDVMIPRDLKVTSLDYSLIGRESVAPLTCMAVPRHEMSCAAIDMAAQLIASRSGSRLPAQVFQARLIDNGIDLDTGLAFGAYTRSEGRDLTDFTVSDAQEQV